MQRKDFLTKEELKVYEDFALSLDTAIVNKYHGVLQELKVSIFERLYSELPYLPKTNGMITFF